MRSESEYCQVPLHFFPNVTLEQYQRFFKECPVIISVEESFEELSGQYLVMDYYSEDHKELMVYIKNNGGMVEIDKDTLAEMMDYKV